MKNFPQQLKGIAIATVFFVGLLYVQAWTGAPAGIPPANNVDAPVNVGVGTQYKSGSLGIGGLLKVYGTFNVETGAGLGKVLTSDANGNASWQTETDPTVPSYIKDGVDWSEVTGKPNISQSSGSVVAGCDYTAVPGLDGYDYSNFNGSCWGGASRYCAYTVFPSGSCPSGSTRHDTDHVYTDNSGVNCVSFYCTKN